MVGKVTSKSFATEVIRSKVPVLVDFYGQDCPPCRLLAPLLDKFAQEYGGKIKIVRFDVTVGKKIAKKYGIERYPNLTYFSNGEPDGNIMGFGTYALLRRELRGFLSKRHVPVSDVSAEIEESYRKTVRAAERRYARQIKAPKAAVMAVYHPLDEELQITLKLIAADLNSGKITKAESDFRNEVAKKLLWKMLQPALDVYYDLETPIEARYVKAIEEANQAFAKAIAAK